VDGAGRLHGTLLRVHLESFEQAVLYWFQPAGRWPAPSALEELLRVFDAMLGRPQYAFVRLVALTGSSPAETHDLTEFAASFAPAVRAQVEQVR
jgi:hypothetical protein